MATTCQRQTPKMQDAVCTAVSTKKFCMKRSIAEVDAPHASTQRDFGTVNKTASDIGRHRQPVSQSPSSEHYHESKHEVHSYSKRRM